MEAKEKRVSFTPVSARILTSSPLTYKPDETWSVYLAASRGLCSDCDKGKPVFAVEPLSSSGNLATLKINCEGVSKENGCALSAKGVLITPPEAISGKSA